MTMKRSVMAPAFTLGGFLLIVLQVFASVEAITVDVKMSEDPDLSQLAVNNCNEDPSVYCATEENATLCGFYQMLEKSDSAKSTLMHRHATVFAPTNKAFQPFKGNLDVLQDLLVLYHMSNLPATINDLKDEVISELDGNPPLWVTRRRAYPHDEVYINNAKILDSFKSTMPHSGSDKTQVLHKIDEVLEPVVSRPTAVPVWNPNAFDFLNQSDSLLLGKLRVRTFCQRMTRTQKEAVFKAEGRYTFFIPVDEGFQPNLRPEKVDAQVIDGHVIPGHVLFTTPTPKNKPYNTLAFSDNLKVTVSFVTRQNKMYVESNTLFGPPDYTTGVVPAEIIKANIPVKNGVVHLIQRPLMVVDTTVQQFLEDKADGPVYRFYETIRDLGDNFMQALTNSQGITLFAPSNAAWDEEGVSHIVQDKQKLREILNLHYVKQKLPLDDIKNKSVNQVKTAAEWKSLYFNVITGNNGSQTVTVEGGGVNATVITANIAATNGIIHIIDRVLGVPYTTVLDKLRTDPMLNSTYYLGTQRGFNDQLNDTKKRFTYFVPRDSAWENARITYPSTYNKLFMPRYNYHTKQILERHLVVSDEAYTMSKLKKMNINGTVVLHTARDVLKLRIREYESSDKYDENAIRPGDNYGYQVEWMGKWIKVFRPDVPCTNGIIHVIDKVFVMPSDVQVTDDRGGASMISVAPHLIMIFVAKWFL